MAQREFNDIYLEMHDSIYRLAAGITGDREDAEDIVQDLYEKLWPKRLVVAAQRNPKGYIFTAARNLCLDRLRGRKYAHKHNGTLQGKIRINRCISINQ